MAEPTNIKLMKPKNKTKKLRAEFDYQGARYVVEFGAVNHGDFPTYMMLDPIMAIEKRKNFYKRFNANPKTREAMKDPLSPMYWSAKILW